MTLQQELVNSHRSSATTPVLDDHGVADGLRRLDGWSIDNARLVKSYHFTTAMDAGQFVNRVGATAEARNHHPHLHWWKRDVRIELWTHKANGLTVRDFEFAACCDPLGKELA